jgi:hypothetical protein
MASKYQRNQNQTQILNLNWTDLDLIVELPPHQISRFGEQGFVYASRTVLR